LDGWTNICSHKENEKDTRGIPTNVPPPVLGSRAYDYQTQSQQDAPDFNGVFKVSLAQLQPTVQLTGESGDAVQVGCLGGKNA